MEARLLAESLRIYEQAKGPPAGTTAAEAAARAAGGNLEQRILNRARTLDHEVGLSPALGHVRAVSHLVIAGVLLLAGVAGAGAGQAAMGLGGGNVVNFFVVLAVALGLETAMLLLWLLFTVARGATAAGLVGRAAADLADRLVRLAHRDAAHLAALRAVGGVMASGGHGRWTLGAITHSAWLVFLSALLLMMLFLLSTRSYVFVWETTILSAETYVPLTRWLAAGPALFGFSGPTPEEIRASQWVGSGVGAPVARDAWAELLVGSIVVYGILPRSVLLVLCLIMRLRAGRRFRLDTARPGYARLAPRLMPAAENLGFADSDAGTEPRRRDVRQDATVGRVQPDPQGPVAVVGLELDAPESGWPPPFDGHATLDLGRVLGRQDLRRSIERLRSSAPPPRLLVLVCALTTTPDRGLLAHVDAVAEASAVPLVLLLTGGQRLRSRAAADTVESRLRDWHALARQAGIDDDKVAELDLDHLTDWSRAKLRALAGGPAIIAIATDRLERAFAAVGADSARWSAAPGLEAQAELHRRIARLYDAEPGWRRWFEPTGATGSDVTTRVRSATDRLVGALPARLALDPRWLKAGAVAGALGCVAVATLAVPAAISGLPLWAGLGAAVAAAVRGALRAHDADEEVESDRTDAVKAAALFALVLDSQGRGEAAITRLIDSAIGDDAPTLDTDAEIAAWLERVRRRYRAAEARKGAG